MQNTIVNLDIEYGTREAIHKLGMVLEDAYEQEYDADHNRLDAWGDSQG